MRRLAAVTFAFAGTAALLSGCGGGSEPTPSRAAPAVTPTTPTVTPTTATATAPTAPASPSAPVSPVSPVGRFDNCGVGRWLLDKVSATASDRATLIGGKGAVLTIRPSGAASLDFSRSGRVVGRVSGMTFKAKYSGTATGTLTVNGNRITAVEQKPAKVTFTLGSRSGTAAIPLLGGSATYQCSAHRLVVHSTGLTVYYSR